MEKTIAAISTAPAPGGIGIVRLSGRKAFSIGEKVFRGVSGKALSQMKGYTAQLGAAFDAAGERLDDVVALVFRAPKSYTGEDVVEISCHGGLYVTKRLLQAVLDAGASPAGPGEFTRRAFVNGKLDLAQAEAVMGLIGASGEQARRAAEAGSTGVLSRRIAAIRGELLEQASHLRPGRIFPRRTCPRWRNRSCWPPSGGGRRSSPPCWRGSSGAGLTGRDWRPSSPGVPTRGSPP